MTTLLLHASLDFRELMVDGARVLEASGFKVLLPDITRYQHIRDVEGRDVDFDVIKNRLSTQNAKLVERSSGVYVLNPSHKGVENYVGGNSFFEMSIAFYLGKPIFLSNPIPEGMSYTEEIRSFYPRIVGEVTIAVPILLSYLGV